MAFGEIGEDAGLTAYEKKEKSVSASSSDIETEPRGKRNGTATPQNGLSFGGKVIKNYSDLQVKTVKSSVGEEKKSLAAEAVETASRKDGGNIDDLEVLGGLEAGAVETGDAGGEEMLTDRQGNPLNADGTLKVEKVRSVDELTDEDFTHPYRNVELPELPKNVDMAIGADGKPVVIKRNIFERNAERHHDLSAEQSRSILTQV